MRRQVPFTKSPKKLPTRTTVDATIRSYDRPYRRDRCDPNLVNSAFGIIDAGIDTNHCQCYDQLKSCGKSLSLNPKSTPRNSAEHARKPAWKSCATYEDGQQPFHICSKFVHPKSSRNPCDTNPQLVTIELKSQTQPRINSGPIQKPKFPFHCIPKSAILRSVPDASSLVTFNNLLNSVPKNVTEF